MILKDPQTNDTRLSDEPIDGWEEITQEELEIIYESRKIADQPLTPLEKLQQLDAENALTQRNLRETIMLMTEAIKTVTQGALDLSQIPGVAKVFEVEAEAKTLREQL